MIDSSPSESRQPTSVTTNGLRTSISASIQRSREHIYELAACHFVRDHRDVLMLGPPGTGKSHIVQAIGLAAIRAGFTAYYRSIFDVVRDFLHDEAMEGHERLVHDTSSRIF